MTPSTRCEGGLAWLDVRAASQLAFTLTASAGVAPAGLHASHPPSRPVRWGARTQDANKWVDALGGRPFMGGAQPNLADLAVFGVCRSVVGTDTFNDLMMHTRIGGWYERMFEAVGSSSRLS